MTQRQSIANILRGQVFPQLPPQFALISLVVDITSGIHTNLTKGFENKWGKNFRLLKTISTARHLAARSESHA